MNNSRLTQQINSYFAVLLVAIAGAGATLLIVHIASANTFTLYGDGEAPYASLLQK